MTAPRAAGRGMKEPRFHIDGNCSACGGPIERVNGDWLRWFRQSRNLTLREVARRAGCSAAFVSDVEHNRRAWSDRLLGGYGLRWTFAEEPHHD